MEVQLESKQGPAVASMAKIINRIGEEINRQQGNWQEQLCQDPSCLGDIEVQVHQLFQGLADQVVAGLLAQVGQHPQLAEDAKKKVIDQAKQPLRAPENRSLLIRLLGGLMVCVSTLYCGPRARTGNGRGREGGGLYPELAVLGIREGSSPGLASQVGRMTALLPSYEVARSELEQRGLALDIKEVHRIAKQLGAEILTTRRRDLERYRAGTLPPGTELKGKRVGAAVDGGRVRTRVKIVKKRVSGQRKKRRCRLRAEWREPKVLIIFEMDERGRMVRGSRPWIDSTFAGPDACMELLAMHLHRLGAVQAERVAFLADGAPWIWDRLPWVQKRVGLNQKQVVEVLDFCHAVHHISLALEALPLEEAERRRQLRYLRRQLRAGRAGRVIAELAALTDDPESAAWTHIAYLEKHAEAGRLRYDKFRKLGVAMGSGAIESAIRRVINLRLKGNGILWYEDNAEAMAAMRAAVLTDRWQETLEHVRETMASDRRLAWTWKSPDMPAELKAAVPIGPPAAQPQEQPGTYRVAA